MFKFYLILLLSVIYVINCLATEAIDQNGYLLYCPCMGRFGNQADHFLGTLAFSRQLNRTLVLPPWVEYRKGEIRSIQVPFDKYFQIEPLLQYHKVITMHKFMKELAPIVWPPEKRISFCYMERKALDGSSERSCNAKDGNPFGPFWDEFNIDFVKSEFYGPLNYDVHHRNMAEKWSEKYPADKWPVIAFTGAPASFPVQKENCELQKYLVFTEEIMQKAQQFILNTLPKGAFIGIHLRNGIDWVRTCEHTKDSPNLFSSAQCLGYMNENGPVTMEICMPSKEIIIRQLKRQIKKIKEINNKNQIKSIFVASDNNHMIRELSEAMERMKVTVHKLPENDPHLDLAILGLSNHFIGNCVSSYTAFVKRARDVRGFPSSFWAFPKEKNYGKDKQQSASKLQHEEL